MSCESSRSRLEVSLTCQTSRTELAQQSLAHSHNPQQATALNLSPADCFSISHRPTSTSDCYCLASTRGADHPHYRFLNGSVSESAAAGAGEMLFYYNKHCSALLLLNSVAYMFRCMKDSQGHIFLLQLVEGAT